MQIVINNTKFPYDLGCRLLKLKNTDCPFPQLADIWNDIVPLSFKEIAKLENLEQRRVGVLCLGLERLASEVKPKLINKKTLKKTTTWVDENGQTVVLTEDYINQFKTTDKVKFEMLHTINRRTTAKITSTTFEPATAPAPNSEYTKFKPLPRL